MKQVNIEETVRKTPEPVDEAAQKQRRKGAWESVLIATIWLVLSGGVLLFLRWKYAIGGFWGTILLGAALMEFVMILPVWILLKTRLKEIQGGEEDAAAKY